MEKYHEVHIKQLNGSNGNSVESSTSNTISKTHDKLVENGRDEDVRGDVGLPTARTRRQDRVLVFHDQSQ